MKAISVIASPKKNGNCKRLVDEITKGIKENDGENTIYFIDDLNIKPCQACMRCKSKENPSKCIIQDDFRKIMDDLEEKDALIFAAPNYFGEINAQGHIFMDRFYSMTKTTPNSFKNDKKAVVIHTYGASTGRYDEYINKRAKLFSSIGLNLVEVMSVGDNMPNNENSEEILEKARDIGREL